MKKLLSCLLMVCLCVAGGLAEEEIDLTGMAYDELVALREKLNLAIWESDEWQEVIVPKGVWEIGVDIPTGHWSISVADNGFAAIRYGDALEETGTEVSVSDSTIYVSESLEGSDQLDIILRDGCYLEVEYDSVVFTPYAGKQDLGFLQRMVKR